MPLQNTATAPRVYQRRGPPPASSPEALRALQDRLTSSRPDPDRARAALWAIPADLPREDWVRIGMAAQASGLSQEDFDAWSATAPDHYDPRAVRDTWKSFKGAGIGAGTLFHAARSHGWQERQEGPPRLPDSPRQVEQPRASVPHPAALAVWDRCAPAPGDHPYIIAKSGTPDGLRLVPEGDPLTIAGQRLAGALAVPAYDAEGRLQSLQFIPAPGQGKKLNLAGANMTGASFTLGEITSGRAVYLCEGIGQAWACHQATGDPAVCAFGWGNVKAIARALVPSGAVLVLVPDVGKEPSAADLARDLGVAVAYLPPGRPPNYDVSDLAHDEGLEALRTLLEAVDLPEPDRSRPPPARELIASEEELAAAKLTPRCIVRHAIYADVGVLVAPGGTGKTTMLLSEAVHIALGWPVWGLEVESPGWTLFVTAEDRRERLLARLREILAVLNLDPAERAVAREGVRIWDVSGEAIKLIRAADGNVVLTDLTDAIVAAYRSDPPAVVIFDPLVSFGASEGMVNDNEQGLVTAARRIVKGLNCCCRLVHHTGKANAREGALDQYAGRGGSALADGSRMMSVLQVWDPEAPGNRQPPPGCHPGPEVSITLLARAKLSYAPPNLPILWIRREGFAYTSFTAEPKLAPAERRALQADQVARFLAAELERERHHTQNSLEAGAETLGLSRQGIRAALAELRVSGRLAEAPLPKHLCHGGRATFLLPVDYRAATFGAVEPAGAENRPQEEITAPPLTTAPPYRGSNPGAVPPGVYPSDSLNCAAFERRSTAQLAKYTESREISADEDAVEEVEL